MEAAKRLETILKKVPTELLMYNEEQASRKPSPEKWCRKEILGHLIDSASNNHQRFVRMQIENNLSLLQYKQNEWVAVQQYHLYKWTEVVELWKIYNLHILHIFKNIDSSKLANTGIFPEYGIKTLQFLIDDYVDHLEHHLKQINSL